MLKKLLEYVLHHRLYVLIIAISLSVYGVMSVRQLDIDVFPDINRPYVTIITEAHGYAPEEVEKLITFHLETALNGAPGVIRVRSNSTVGMSMVIAEFDWGYTSYVCRQVVQERLQLAFEKLPPNITPMLAPTSSVTGEVMRLALTSDGRVNARELRTLADWTVRTRLLTIAGVAQVFTIGGEAQEYQVVANSEQLHRHGLSIHDLEETLASANTNTSGGVLYQEDTELLVRNIGRPEHISELEDLIVKSGPHGSVRLHDVATVKTGARIPTGAAGLNEQDAVIINVLKQPETNTLELTARLQVEIAKLRNDMPEGVTLHDDIYRQATFINTAIDNVIEAVRDGTLLVIAVLLVFLLNLRMSVIILTAIPLSILTTFITFEWLGVSINTMTLGGIAVAVGELVDGAIVGAENIYRKLRINLTKPVQQRQAFLEVVSSAVREVYPGILLGTVIVLLVVIPLFALPGFVGRIFSPIATAYLVAIFCSMVVSITVTPVLASFLLRGKLPGHGKDTRVVMLLKKLVSPVVCFSSKFPLPVLVVAGLISLWSLYAGSRIGLDLLAEFNEGAVFVVAMAPPGTRLDLTDRLSRAAAISLENVPELRDSKIGRRAGRSEGDEHAHSGFSCDIEAEIKTPEGQKRRPLDEIMEDVRAALATVPGLVYEVGQPIQHLISHLLGGARAEIVIKLFGPNLDQLQQLGQKVHQTIVSVPGVVDSHVEPQVMIPQLRIIPDSFELARYGLRLGDLLEILETSLQGEVVSEVFTGENYFGLMLRGEDRLRESAELIADLFIPIPSGGRIPLRTVAAVEEHFGPNMVNHENTRRRLFVLANVSGRDLSSTVHEISERLSTELEVPSGYTWRIGGQYEQLIESSRAVSMMFAMALVLMLVLLAVHFRSLVLAGIVLLNIPQAMIGAVLALLLTGTALDMGALVGFVALCGIASRNGILLISHWGKLLREPGSEFGPALLLQGCLDRLTPVLMTALTTNLGLIPLVLAKGQPGKEILYSVAVVIFGGMVTSTFLDFTITPAAAMLVGRRAIMRLASDEVDPLKTGHPGGPGE